MTTPLLPDYPHLEPAPPAPPARPRSRAPLVLALVVALGVLFLGQRLRELYEGDPAIEDRRDRIERIERAWRDRLAAAGEETGHRERLRRVERWRELVEPGEMLPWRRRPRTPEAPPDRPLSAPASLRGRFEADRARIVLAWEPPAGAETVAVLRSHADDPGAVEIALIDGLAESWEDEPYGLVGDVTYRLRARRGDLESPEATVRVRYRIEPAIALVEVLPDGRRARLRVAPRPDAPRPRHFLERVFTVAEGGEVGKAQGLGFDYRTGYVLREVGEVEVTEWVEIEAERFTADGTVRRGPAGRAITEIRPFPREVRRPYVLLEGPDLPARRLRLDR